MVDTVVGRWTPTEVMERVLDGTWAEVVDGMALIEPASIAFSGTSAAIVGLGSVEFSAVTSLSLNGVFSSLFDNYMVVVRHVSNTGSNGTVLRLRSAGTDATGSNYTRQYIEANSTTVSGGRDTTTSARVTNVSDSQRGGDSIYIYGPYLAQSTAFRNVGVPTFGSAGILDYASTHSLSTSYDGFTFAVGANNMTGRIAVYGMVK